MGQKGRREGGSTRGNHPRRGIDKSMHCLSLPTASESDLGCGDREGYAEQPKQHLVSRRFNPTLPPASRPPFPRVWRQGLGVLVHHGVLNCPNSECQMVTGGNPTPHFRFEGKGEGEIEIPPDVGIPAKLEPRVRVWAGPSLRWARVSVALSTFS